MKTRSRPQPELFWPRVVMRKWLNISAKDSDYSADTEDENYGDSDSDSDTDEFGQRGRESRFKKYMDGIQHDPDDALPIIRRRKSETFRAQYISAKELRICVGTWNVGGKLPPDDLDIEDWLDSSEPADMYVLGLQEIVPLNAGNIFGAEDNRPVPKWENIIRETLDRLRFVKPKVKCYSDPSSPSRFKPSDEVQDIEDELSFESDSDYDEEIHPVDVGPNSVDEFCCNAVTNESDFLNSGVSESTDGPNSGVHTEQDCQGQFSSPKKLDRLNCLRTEDCTGNSEASTAQYYTNFLNSGVSESTDGPNSGVRTEQDFQRRFSSSKKVDRLSCLRTEDCTGNSEASIAQYYSKLSRTLSGTERIGLTWPEPPLDLLARHMIERPKSFKSFKEFRSFKTYSSFKSFANDDRAMPTDLAVLAELDLESLMRRKRKSPFVRIVSKQMVGIFLTIWVRRRLRRHIQNVRVSTVGVGVMGYIGNKGSISVSMSINQTLFCFICTHLTSGEKDGDELKRNADVLEIRRRTHFHSSSKIGLPRSIEDHERIIWLGDLNYRINLPYEETRKFIAKKDWSKLSEKDQLVRELRKGRAFDGWSEGRLKFPPTYKYEFNSERYFGEEPKAGRRTPAWCDRILSYGKGLRLLRYRRTELRLSDHRPVTATYMADVEVLCPRKLQRALTFTNAEIEEEEVVTDLGLEVGMSHLRLGEDSSEWDRYEANS